jgi:hypothetical protein
VVLRKFDHDTLTYHPKPKISNNGAAPFGYCFQNGKLIEDTKEYRTVLAILALWRQGMRMKAIASHLNANKIPTRHGISWNPNLVKMIIKRNQNKK